MYIDEMMTFLHKLKFPMINIATIITITNQNCFLLWSDVFLFLEQFIVSAKRYRYWSIVPYPVWFPIIWSPTAPVLTFEGDSVEEVDLWSLTLLFRWSKTKSKSPWNFEESTYVASVYLPRVIYENVDIVFIGIYNKHLSYPLSILKVILVKSN
jgi:hypothetical protein